MDSAVDRFPDNDAEAEEPTKAGNPVGIKSRIADFARSVLPGTAPRCDLFSLWTAGSGVLGTNVSSKLLVTLDFVFLLHFIQ